MKQAMKDIENLSFEEAIKALTDIVSKVETGQIALQESLAQYEKGMLLIRHCRGILKKAEQRIEKISTEPDTAGPKEDA